MLQGAVLHHRLGALLLLLCLPPVHIVPIQPQSAAVPGDSKDLPSPFCENDWHWLLAAGAEALYADMGHFSISAIRVCSFAWLACPGGCCDRADTLTAVA